VERTSDAAPVVNAGARPRPPIRERRSVGLMQRIWAGRWMYLFVAPPVLGFIIFFAYPAVFAFYSSFFKFNNFKFNPLPTPWDNYARAIRDATLHRSFVNVLEMFAISFTLGQLASLLVAVFLNFLKQFVGFFRTIYYLPMVTSVVIVSTLFRWILRNDAAGIANVALKSLTGLGPIRWLWEEWLVIPAISMVSVWISVGGSVIIWTAGLKGVPKEIYEAATIDGANRWRQFWGVTLPLLKPVAMYQAVLGFIGGMKAFALNFTMTGGGYESPGGPGNASMTPVLMVYQYGFKRLQMGYASAVAYILSIVILLISILQFRLFGSPELYD
jgi:multiple sugar transport system permease protein